MLSERIEVAGTATERAAKRASAEGIASSLLQQRVPLPRLSHVPVTVEPNRVLAGPEDTPTTTTHGQPADLKEPVASTSKPNSSDLQPSSLAATATPAAASLTDLTAVAMSNLVEVAPLDTGSGAIGPPVLGQARRQQTTKDVPRVYRLRVAPNRSEIAMRYGATSESEEAVHAALKWLADNQERDGRWNPARHRGGDERHVFGRDRFGAGAQADMGISALALLAFLASGHTHEEGLYRENVQRGLEFLLRSQGSDLAAPARPAEPR